MLDSLMYEHLYWICFACLLLYAWFDKEKITLASKFIVYIPLLVLMAFTLAITVEQFDIGTYRRIFYRLTEPPPEWRIDLFPEYGYQYLNYLFNGVLGWSFEQFRLLYAFAILSVLFFSASRLTDKQGLFFLLYYPKYFLIGLISHSRSGFVNAFIFFAIDMAARKQYVRIAIMSFALMQIHFSAILLNGISILSKFKLHQVYVLGVIPFSIVFSKWLLPGVTDALNIFDVRQLNYLVTDETVERGMFGIEFFRRLALVGVCAYIVAYKKIESQAEALIIQVFLVSIFFYIGFHEARFISDRVGGMLGFVEPMMWIVFMQNHFMPKNKMLAYVLVLAYVFLDFLMRAIYIDGLPGHPPIIDFINHLAIGPDL